MLQILVAFTPQDDIKQLAHHSPSVVHQVSSEICLVFPKGTEVEILIIFCKQLLTYTEILKPREHKLLKLSYRETGVAETEGAWFETRPVWSYYDTKKKSLGTELYNLTRTDGTYTSNVYIIIWRILKLMIYIYIFWDQYLAPLSAIKRVVDISERFTA